MRRAFRVLCMSFFLMLPPPLAHAQKPPPPETYFGHRMGEEGKIIDFLKSLEYYKELAAQSDRIRYTEPGKTTDGHPFALLIISSPQNLSKLDEYKRKRDRLHDPRKINDEEARRLAAELPAVAFHTSSIHSTEISTAQVIPELVYNLVSGDSDEIRRILDHVIVLIAPSANPDGQVKLKAWYDQHAGTAWESNMPWQYHTYIGHDNNRDWILLHFPEQRLTATEIFLGWHPVYSHEMHQMGGNGARIFVPPYQDPYDYNTAPQVMEIMNMVGAAMSHRMTMEGKAGVVKNAIFDLFTPARAFQIYRGTARILTETASANFARKRVLKPEALRASSGGTGIYDPLKVSWNYPMPWKGGEWTFRAMVEYQLSAAMAALHLAASHRTELNLAQYQALKWAMEREDWPYAFVFPADQPDPGTTARLLQALQRGAVEVHRAGGDFVAGGRTFKAGSHVVLLRQPYGAWAKTLLEVQAYPDLRRSPDDPPVVPYDVTAQTLPLMMGVDAVQIEQPFEANLKRMDDRIRFAGEVSGDGPGGFVLLPHANEAFAVADQLLDDGLQVSRVSATAAQTCPAGSFYVAPANGLSRKLRDLAGVWNFRAVGLQSPLSSAQTTRLHNPRIAVYEPWGGLMDAGWTRLVLEQYTLEFTMIRNADLQKGDLNARYDIILFPEGLSAERLLNGNDNWPDAYKGGIGKDGKAALAAFIRAGGVVAAFGRSSMALTEMLDLPVANTLEGLPRSEYFGPGSLVLIHLDPSSPLAYGLPDRLPVMNRQGPAFAPKATIRIGPEMAGWYPGYDPRMSGFLLGQEHLQGKGAIAVQPMGAGRVILFSINPQFRAMTHGAYKLIFNAIFWSAQDAAS